MISAVVVDDEARAVKSLQITLEKYCKDVSVIGIANNIKEAQVLIDEKLPQLIFLDINLPDGTGIDLLKKNPEMNSRVIFVTAYDEYIVQALRLAAFDYLLKPIDKDELILAIDRLKNELLSQYAEQFRILTSTLSNRPNGKIAINTLEGLDIVDLDEVLFLSSEGNYTKFHLRDHKLLIASKPIGTYESLLTDYLFYRIHRSYLVNTSHINSFRKKESSVLLSDGSQLEVSKRKKEELLSILTSS